MKIILPESMDAPTIPVSFLAGLRNIDLGLVIYWNRFKNRFVVDRCTITEPHTHTATCPRANVLIVQDDEGHYMSPNDRVLEKIKSMDAWRDFGGNDEAALLRFRRKHEIEKEEYDAKALEASREAYREAGLDNKVQLNKAIHLIQQHDTARVH